MTRWAAAAAGIRRAPGAAWPGFDVVGLIITDAAGPDVNGPLFVRIASTDDDVQASVGFSRSVIRDAVFGLRGSRDCWDRLAAGSDSAVVSLLRGSLVVEGAVPAGLPDWLSMFTHAACRVDAGSEAAPSTSRLVPQPLPVPGDTRYARAGTLHIAYKTFGEGPIDLVLVPGMTSHVDYLMTDEAFSRFVRRLTGLCRVILFDRRGTGLSDVDPRRTASTLQDGVDDLDAVLRATDSRRPVLLSYSQSGPSTLLFAAQSPERVAALVLVSTAARFSRTDDYPQGVPYSSIEAFFHSANEAWGNDFGVDLLAPSMAHDGRFRRWWAGFQRVAVSPGAVTASLPLHLEADVRHLLPSISMPTLVLHQAGDVLIPAACGRYLADHIPDGRYVEIPGGDHAFWLSSQDATLAAIHAFVRDLPGIQTCSSRPIRRPKSGWESLTRSELDVARLVRQGLTNPQIAQRLHVSARTVQSHVAHVFEKLGLSRRSELAVEASRRLL